VIPAAAPPAARDFRHDGIAIETEEGHRGREHAGAFVLGFVQQFARGACDDGMRPGLAEMGGFHHRLERRFDRALGIGEKGRDAGERLADDGRPSPNISPD
jgi:hypothetical protein